MANRERKNVFTLYLSDQEYALLKAKTEAYGLPSMASYMREMIKNGYTYSVDFRELHRYNFLLSNLTNNLNQIAHQANATGSVSNADLEEARRILEDVWQLQKSMLSDLQFKNP